MAQTSLIGIWRAGDEFSYAIEDKNSISTGTDILNQSLKLDTNWHVKTVGVDGSAVITVTIERVRFKADQKGIPLPFEELSFDSENPVEARNKGEMSTFGALNAFVGSQMSITINEKRELSKFDLSEPLAAHLEKNQMTLELAGGFGHTFTTNGMRRRMTSWLIPSPSKPVSKGETWRREQSSRYEDFFVCLDTYTMEGSTLGDGQTLTKIDVKTELALSDNNKGKRQAKIAEQSGGGFVYFDEQTGRVIEATLRHQIAEESPYAPRLINTTINAKLFANRKQ
jgi:hypothetical protein